MVNSFKWISCLLFGFLSINNVLAKEVSLYNEPKTDAKVVGKVNLSTGIIPIYTPKEGDWMKVADPRNGNVGWVKSNELSDSKETTVTFTQRIMNEGKGPHTYQIIQYGQPQKITGEQVQNMVQKMQMQQKDIQQSMQAIIQNMVNEMNNLYQRQYNTGVGNAPIIMPILILPPQQSQQKSAAPHPTPMPPGGKKVE